MTVCWGRVYQAGALPRGHVVTMETRLLLAVYWVEIRHTSQVRTCQQENGKADVLTGQQSTSKKAEYF